MKWLVSNKQMNWLAKINSINIGSNRDSESSKSKVPDGLWNNCPACDAILIST